MKTIVLLFLVCGALSLGAQSRAFVKNLQKVAPFEVTSYENSRFRDWTDEELKTLCGTVPLDEPVEDKVHEVKADIVSYPTTYDFRTAHSNCIPQIRDQASCGSCYAFGAATTFQAKRCLKTGSNLLLSTQDIVSCCTTTHGCNGGAMEYSFNYFYSYGVVSESCYPYTSASGTVAACSTTCTGSGSWVKYKTSSSYKRYSGLDAMKNEVYNNGPVEVMMEVFYDFYYYSSGIYQHTSGSSVGLHAITMLGWGIDNGVKYLILQNSWGQWWGESGTFRIREDDDSFANYGSYGIAALI